MQRQKLYQFGLVALSLLFITTIALAGDQHDEAELPVIEATIPDSLHTNDSALTPPDRAIVARVRATLVATPALSIDGDHIYIAVRHSNVTISGTVGSEALKKEIDMRVPLIPGVKSFENQLAVAAPRESSL